MNANGFFVEKQPWGETHYEVVPDSHISFKTARQQVDLITNPRFGRMLFLDGVLQSASADEHIYHEALVDFGGLNSHSRAVLIVGGAEGGVAREVEKEVHVAVIDMVDWDGELVNYLYEKEHMNKPFFTDSRLTTYSMDILEYLKEPKYIYDKIFLDLLDINTEEEWEFTQKVLKSLIPCVKRDKTTVVLNVGASREIAERFQGDIREIFVPSFQEPWYLVKLCL